MLLYLSVTYCLILVYCRLLCCVTMPLHCPLVRHMLYLFCYVMCVNINKTCNVLCSQSLCEVIVNSCREVQSKSSFVFRVLPFLDFVAVLGFVAVIIVSRIRIQGRKIRLYFVTCYFVFSYICKTQWFYIGAPTRDELMHSQGNMVSVSDFKELLIDIVSSILSIMRERSRLSEENTRNPFVNCTNIYRTEDGQPICYCCLRVGHVAKYCWDRKLFLLPFFFP